VGCTKASFDYARFGMVLDQVGSFLKPADAHSAVGESAPCTIGPRMVTRSKRGLSFVSFIRIVMSVRSPRCPGVHVPLVHIPTLPSQSSPWPQRMGNISEGRFFVSMGS
jgi:hypothetical protein